MLPHDAANSREKGVREHGYRRLLCALSRGDALLPRQELFSRVGAGLRAFAVLRPRSQARLRRAGAHPNGMEQDAQEHDRAAHPVFHRSAHGALALVRHHRLFHLPRHPRHHALALYPRRLPADGAAQLRARHVVRRGEHGGRSAHGARALRRRERGGDGGGDPLRRLLRRPRRADLVLREPRRRADGDRSLRQRQADVPDRRAALCALPDRLHRALLPQSHRHGR